jgi:hypothetical protein
MGHVRDITGLRGVLDKGNRSNRRYTIGSSQGTVDLIGRLFITFRIPHL